MKKIGVVGIPDGWSSNKLADTVERKTGYRLLIDMEQIKFDSSKKTVFFEDIDLSSLDALIIKKVGKSYSADLIERLEFLNYLHCKGMPIFSNPLSIMRCLDRLTCTLTLSQAGIPLPPTIITEKVNEATSAIREFGRAILKPLYTSKARGMQVFNSDDPDLAAHVADYQCNTNSVIYIQKMITIPGRDMGIVFLGGKHLATYARVSHKDAWNTTTASGGHYEPVTPNQELIELAYWAQEPFGLDFTCVDLAETPEGPVVFEVSAFGGFRGLWDAYGMDASELFTDYVLKGL